MTNQELNEIIADLNQTQREALEKYLEYQTYLDEDDIEIASIKKDAYSLYKDTIAGLIAKIEVYSHDLPMPLLGIIDNIVRMHSHVPKTVERDKAIKEYEQIIQYEKFFINILYLMLTRLYVSQIKAYIKVLKRFNHRGVCIENTPVLYDAKRRIKSILCLVRQGKKILKNVYSINWIQTEMFISNVPAFIRKFANIEAFIMIDGSQLIHDLSSAFHIAQETLNLCETNFPNIVNNGYNDSLFKRLWNNMPMILSFLLALYGFITIYYKLLGA